MLEAVLAPANARDIIDEIKNRSSHLLTMSASQRFLSLRKGTKSEVANTLEEELHNARSTFEKARFNLVTALSNVEANKRFEFLEVVSGTMDVHLCYFKKVLTYAQQSRERSNYEQAALNERISSHKMIEAVMQSAAKGKVGEEACQNYLPGLSLKTIIKLKGRLKKEGSSSQHSGQRNSSELGSGLLSRWLSSYHHGGVHDEKSVAHHTVNLFISTIKVDVDQLDLRFCFRIISPTKNYTLQAESALDQMHWIEKITSVIASLLSSQILERLLPTISMGSAHNRSTSESNSFESSDFDHTAIEEFTAERNPATTNVDHNSRSLQLQ
ncbi:hypothetical protein AHAS_Ahas13G0337400 [Arachis hypogaea]